MGANPTKERERPPRKRGGQIEREGGNLDDEEDEGEDMKIDEFSECRGGETERTEEED